MALLEFVDNQGVAWKVWDVTPEKMHPVTAAEMFLGEYQEGWLAFESASERRRLARFPVDWESASRDKLAAMLEQAAPVAPRKRREGPSGEFRRLAEGEALKSEEQRGHEGPERRRT